MRSRWYDSAVTLYEELRGVLDALDGAGVDYALIGALAVAVWGAPRATKDIDLLVQRRDVEKALGAARTRGFTLEALPFEFKDGTELRRVSKMEPPGELLTLDLMIVDKNLTPAWDSRIPAVLRGRAGFGGLPRCPHRHEGACGPTSGRDGHPEPEGDRSMKVDMSPEAIDARMRQASRLAGSLRTEERLWTKIDLQRRRRDLTAQGGIRPARPVPCPLARTTHG